MRGHTLCRRAVWLTARLMQGGVMTYTEYAERYGLTLRTYRRDLLQIGSFGVLTKPQRDHSSGRVVFAGTAF